MKKFYLFLFLLSVFSTLLIPPNCALASASGFIPGQIWYSKEPLVEGETVNIHTAIWNGEKNSLSVKIEFYDKNVILGSREVVLSPSELKDVSVSWKITPGDHVISAKIISSLAIVSGEKEKIVLERIVTSNDKQFVSLATKDDAITTFSQDKVLLKDQIEKTTSEINNIIPEEISTPIANSFGKVEDFRNKISTQINTIKDDEKNKLDLIKSENKTKVEIQDGKVVTTTNITDKPIAYIKVFLFSILSFILHNKIVFYGFFVIILFYILRFIYRKIRNR